MNNTLVSQEKQKIESSKIALKSYFRLPNITSNKFYKGVSRGISDIGISVNYNVFKGINLGLGYKHSLFEISQFKITENLDAKTHFYGPFMELSYVYNLTEKLFIEPSLKAGSLTMLTTSNPCRSNGISQHKKNTTFYAPSINLFLRGIDRIAYSFSIGYTVTQTNFSPKDVCLEYFAGYSEPDFKNNLHHINIGFGVLFYLGKMNVEK